MLDVHTSRRAADAAARAGLPRRADADAARRARAHPRAGGGAGRGCDAPGGRRAQPSPRCARSSRPDDARRPRASYAACRRRRDRRARADGVAATLAVRACLGRTRHPSGTKPGKRARFGIAAPRSTAGPGAGGRALDAGARACPLRYHGPVRAEASSSRCAPRVAATPPGAAIATPSAAAAAAQAARAASAAASPARAAQRPWRSCDLLAASARACPARASRARTAGRRSAARRGTPRSPSSPSSPSPTSAWRSRLEPSGVWRVVEVQRAEPVEADDARRSRRAPPPAPPACGSS